MEFYPCTLGDFKNLESEINLHGIDKPGWFCIKDLNFNLQGLNTNIEKTTF